MISGCLLHYFEPIEPDWAAQRLNQLERASQGGARNCAIEPTAYRAQSIYRTVEIGLAPLLYAAWRDTPSVLWELRFGSIYLEVNVMKSGVKLAHPSQCREIVSPADLERYLAQGWCELKKPVSKLAARQRQFRRQRKEQGYKRFTAFLPLQIFDALTAMKLPGETMADLLLRLIDTKHMLDEHN